MAQNRLQKLIRPGCPRWVDCVAKLFVTAAYIYTLLRLPWLAPDIITAVVNGRQPPQLNAKKLMRVTAHLPTDWAEQRALLGFR